MDRVSPVPAAFRKHTRPKAPVPGSSKAAANSKVAVVPKPTPTLVKSVVPPANTEPKTAKSSSRNIYSLKDRVIYMLALKPHTREHIVTKLKKGKKKKLA